MGYKLLGYAVWKGAKMLIRTRFGQFKKPAAAVFVVLAVAAIAALAARRESA